MHTPSFQVSAVQSETVSLLAPPSAKGLLLTLALFIGLLGEIEGIRGSFVDMFVLQSGSAVGRLFVVVRGL